MAAPASNPNVIAHSSRPGLSAVEFSIRRVYGYFLRMARKVFAWALRIKQWEQDNKRSHPLTERLSNSGQKGLDYAEHLAGAARARSYTAIGQEHPDYDDATIRDVRGGHDEWVSATTVRNRIAHARWELFGGRSDRAVRRFLARIEKATQECEAEGCEEALPRGTTSRRKYCAWHAQPWAKAERHRVKRGQA